MVVKGSTDNQITMVSNQNVSFMITWTLSIVNRSMNINNILLLLMFILNIHKISDYSSNFISNSFLYDILIIKGSTEDNITKVSN